MAPNEQPEGSSQSERLARIEAAVEKLAKKGYPHDRVEPIVWVLLLATLTLVGVVVGISKWSPNDGQTFQFTAGLATGFAGSLLTRIKPQAEAAKQKPDAPVPTELK